MDADKLAEAIEQMADVLRYSVGYMYDAGEDGYKIWPGGEVCGSFAGMWAWAHPDNFLPTDDDEVMATHLVRFLGFSGREELADWAGENPDIWGNEYGGEIFTHRTAFDDTMSGQGIIEHLESVLERLEASG